MTRTTYISPDGKEFARLPNLYNNVSPITPSNCEALGWTIQTEELPDPESYVNENLILKEKAFVASLLEHANSLEIDLLTIPDLNITSLKTAAASAGATEEQISVMSSSLMVLAFDIMSETDQPWSMAWKEFKSRLPGYMQELMTL